VIIGAGVIGSSIALELSRKGFKTLNIDKENAAGCGSTSFSSGICRMYYSVLDAVKVSWESYWYWKHWQEHIQIKDERGLVHLRECGGLVIKTPESQAFLAKSLPLFDICKIDYEELSAAETQKRFNILPTYYGPCRLKDDPEFGVPAAGVNGKEPEIDGCVYFPQTGYISDPQLATHNLQMAAEATGKSTFLFNSTVTSIDHNNERIQGLTLSNGTKISCRVVVNAAGPYSNKITKMAFGGGLKNDMNVTTKALRQEVAYVPTPENSHWMDGPEGVITSDLGTGAYWRPEIGGKVLIGGTEPACDNLQWIDDPDKCNMSLTDYYTNLVYRCALRIPNLPMGGSSNTMGIVAMYDVTEDWTPIYDKSALKGFYMAIGTSGNQFKNSPLAGKIMASIIEQCENGVDHDKKPVQFDCHRTGVGSINTGRFSRLRQVLETSKCVLG
jgi:sarcosine oxidase subunit beta